MERQHVVLQLRESNLTMQQYIDWLKNYFQEKSALPEGIEEINYFEANLIDSLELIEMIESIETQFGIKFNEMHFQERRFSTMKGLAEIINEIKQEQLA